MIDLDLRAPDVRSTTASGASSHEVRIESSAEAIWTQLTVPRRIQPFYGSVMLAEPLVIGMPIVYQSSAGRPQRRGTVVAVEPPRRLVHTLQYVGIDEPESEVTWQLADRDPGCHVRLEHHGLGPGSRSAELSDALWPIILQNLKVFIEVELPRLGPRWPRVNPLWGDEPQA